MRTINIQKVKENKYLRFYEATTYYEEFTEVTYIAFTDILGRLLGIARRQYGEEDLYYPVKDKYFKSVLLSYVDSLKETSMDEYNYFISMLDDDSKKLVEDLLKTK